MIYGWRSGSGPCWRAICRGIASWKLIETMRPGAAVTPFPDRFKQIGSKNFPMPEKTHPVSCRVTASFRCVMRLAEDSAGGT